MSYGMAAHIAIEQIETEAIFHYAPGANILSLGNLGCNIEDVNFARHRALEKGLRYSYIGNAFEGEEPNTYCPECLELLIERYGLHTYIKDSIDQDGKRRKCRYQTTIKLGGLS